jgi:hypothetical protein
MMSQDKYESRRHFLLRVVLEFIESNKETHDMTVKYDGAEYDGSDLAMDISEALEES